MPDSKVTWNASNATGRLMRNWSSFVYDSAGRRFADMPFLTFSDNLELGRTFDSLSVRGILMGRELPRICGFSVLTRYPYQLSMDGSFQSLRVMINERYVASRRPKLT